MKSPYHKLASRARWQAVALRGAILAAGWWVLTEGSAQAVPFGVVMVGGALYASLLFSPASAPTWRALALLRFAAVFLVGSLRGGIDVARSAVFRARPLSPEFVTFHSRLESTRAQDIFMSAVSLMPGTLGVERNGQDLEIHVLFEVGARSIEQLRALEVVVAHASGTALAPRT